MCKLCKALNQDEEMWFITIKCFNNSGKKNNLLSDKYSVTISCTPTLSLHNLYSTVYLLSSIWVTWTIFTYFVLNICSNSEISYTAFKNGLWGSEVVQLSFQIIILFWLISWIIALLYAILCTFLKYAPIHYR